MTSNHFQWYGILSWNVPFKTVPICSLMYINFEVQVLALASLAQVLVRVQLAHTVQIEMKCDLYVIRMEQYSIFCQ